MIVRGAVLERGTRLVGGGAKVGLLVQSISSYSLDRRTVASAYVTLAL